MLSERASCLCLPFAIGEQLLSLVSRFRFGLRMLHRWPQARLNSPQTISDLRVEVKCTWPEWFFPGAFPLVAVIDICFPVHPPYLVREQMQCLLHWLALEYCGLCVASESHGTGLASLFLL